MAWGIGLLRNAFEKRSSERAASLLAASSSAVRVATISSSSLSRQAACRVTSHFLVIECAICSTSTLSKGFFSSTRFSLMPSFSVIVSHE